MPQLIAEGVGEPGTLLFKSEPDSLGHTTDSFVFSRSSCELR